MSAVPKITKATVEQTADFAWFDLEDAHANRDEINFFKALAEGCEL